MVKPNGPCRLACMLMRFCLCMAVTYYDNALFVIRSAVTAVAVAFSLLGMPFVSLVHFRDHKAFKFLRIHVFCSRFAKRQLFGTQSDEGTASKTTKCCFREYGSDVQPFCDYGKCMLHEKT